MWFLLWLNRKVATTFTELMHPCCITVLIFQSLSDFRGMPRLETQNNVSLFKSPWCLFLTNNRKEPERPGKHTHPAPGTAVDSPWATRGCPSWFQSCCHPHRYPCHCRCRWQSRSAGSSRSAGWAEANRTPSPLSICYLAALNRAACFC